MSFWSKIQSWWADFVRKFRPQPQPPPNPVPPVPVPPAPEPPTPPAPQPPSPGETVFETQRGFRIAGLLATPQGIFCCTYKTNRRPKTSRVYIDWYKRHQDDSETIGQPFAVDDAVYFPAEHRKYCLTYTRGGFHAGARSPGKWSVAGFDSDGVPAVAFNNAYSGGKMHDEAVVINPLTGKKVFTVRAKMMPLSLCNHDDIWWAAGWFGINASFNERGELASPAPTHIASLHGELWGGGLDGDLYHLSGRSWYKRAILDPVRSMHLIAHGDYLYYTGGRPNRAYRIDSEGRSELLYKDDVPDNGRNAFGNRITVAADGTVYLAVWDAKKDKGKVVTI